MKANPRLKWRPTRKLLVIIGLILAIAMVIELIFLEIILYGTGFAGKTLWDWFQLLIIPAVLAVGGYAFTYTTSRNDRAATEKRTQAEREAAERHAQTERDIALDNQREAALKEYFEKMSELLLHENLRYSDPGAEVRKIARVWTLIVLQRLDGNRKGNVLYFLHDSDLIDKNNPKIDLIGADLHEADLILINLSGANLSRANLYRANLSEATLSGASLNEATLLRIDLTKANLMRANLIYAKLFRANLSEADLSEADLGEAYMDDANLKGAKVTPEQLAEAKSLKGASMPDGSIHP